MYFLRTSFVGPTPLQSYPNLALPGQSLGDTVGVQDRGLLASPLQFLAGKKFVPAPDPASEAEAAWGPFPLPFPSRLPQAMSNAPPPHDLTPSLFHSWAPFWELEGGGSPGVGWGGGLWPGKGAPRPAAQTPWHVFSELSRLWRWPPRPWPWPRAAARDLAFPYKRNQTIS